ncbi:MAG: 3-oxoacyl-[acyl-carrier-protein] reductase [Thermoanaerobaculales bacterium]|jgi:3-oxoacyl-[acyl-carrier protein] reductase|nr:3-oxoacyl-[acyl-carrier-protein] reductase [Thermoanaerobaculales bacterium]
MGDFDGQIAVITGGARGIGAEIARRLAAGGAHVVCADLLDTTEIVAEITAAGGSAEGRPLDVTDGEVAAATIQEIHGTHGRLDILVNNAGITRDQLLVRMKPQDWDLVLKINLDGVFLVTQPAAKIMMRQRSGRIVNIASVVGLMGNGGQTNYASSKAGLIGFTKALARELGPRNVTVNAVAPGYIQTAMTDALTDEQREALMKSVAIPRLGTATDVADAVAFLAGPGASYITGTVVNVSGGLYM